MYDVGDANNILFLLKGGCYSSDWFYMIKVHTIFYAHFYMCIVFPNFGKYFKYMYVYIPRRQFQVFFLVKRALSIFVTEH